MEPSDTLLLERWRNGRDAQAFAVLVSRYSGLVYGTSRRILGSADDAEDTAQECFLTLAQRRVHFDTYLGPWLHRVAVTQSLNRIKAESRRRQREQRYAEQRPVAEERTWDDIQAYVDEGIADLPEKLRRPVVLHFLEGRSQNEVAQSMGLPRTTVTSRIAQGIERVRKHLRRRGIAITATALGALLSANAVEAAPATLVASLGKLALAGSGTGAIAAVAGRAILSMKPFVYTAAAVLILGLAATGLIPFLDTSESAAGGKTPATVVEDTTDASVSTSEEIPADTILAAVNPATPPEPGISGTVLDKAGVAVADAEVVAVLNAERKKRATSGADGAFLISELTPGSYQIVAFKETVGAAVISDVGETQALGPITLEPMAAIRGRAYDKTTGEPIPGLSLSLSSFGRDAIRSHFKALDVNAFEVTTDREGKFTIRDLTAEKYLLDYRIYASDYAFPGYQEPPIYVTLANGEQRELNLALELGGTIAGTVTTTDSAPIAGARVQVVPSRHSYFQLISVKTDDQGRYVMRGLPTRGNYTVFALHTDYAEAESDTVTLVEPGDAKEVDVQLPLGHAVRGRLLFATGAPAAGADVCFRGGNGHRTTTDARGAFSFEHVSPGEHQLWCNRDTDWHVDSPRVSFTMPAERDLNDLVLTLAKRSAGSVTGRVTDAAANPVAGVRVNARSDGITSTGKYVQDETTTNERGEYRLEALGDAETLTVDAYPDHYAFQRKHDVPVNSAGVDFVLASYATVRGRVLDQSGQPVPHFEIRNYYVLDEQRESEHETEWQVSRAEDGTFHLDEVAPPVTWLEVRASGYSPALTERMDIEPGQNLEGVEIRLQPGGIVSGQILDNTTNHPIGGVRVRAFAPPRFHMTMIDDREQAMDCDVSIVARSDAEGRFTFSNLTPGSTVSFVAWHDGYECLVLPRIEVPANAKPDLVLSLAPEGRLEVIVTEGGQPAEGVAVTIYRADLDSPAEGYWTGRPSGGLFGGLSPGRYGIMVSTTGSARRQLGIVEADVESGETTLVEATLDDFPSMFGSITGAVERASGYVSVRARSANVLDYMNVTSQDDSGHFELTGLPPGNYTVTASDHFATASAEVTVSAGAAASVALTLE